MFLLLLTNCLCAVVLTANCSQHLPESSNLTERPLSELTVVVTDSFGSALPDASLVIRDLTEKDSPVRLSGKERRLIIQGGRYAVSAELSGFISASRVIEVYHPHTSLSIGLAIGNISGSSRQSVSGRLSHLESYRSVAVKLIGVYVDDHLDATVLDDGTFKVEGVLPGEYLAIVLRHGPMPEKGTVLAMSRVSRNLDDESELRIAIGTFSLGQRGQ